MSEQDKKLLIQEKQLQLLSSIIRERSAVAAKLGKSFSNKRDLYETLGYVGYDGLTHDNCLAKFKRQDIAKRVVRAYPEEAWEKAPIVTDESDGESSFETEYAEFAETLNIYNFCKRIDVLAGIGEYAVLMIGFNDNRDMKEEVTSASEILYLQPYGQWSARIHSLDDDPKSPRYGKPLAYSISFSEPSSIGESTKLREFEVHHSRVIHVSKNLLESDVFGTMELECVYNRLDNIELLSGGSAEMYWQGAMRGLAFLAREGYDMAQTASSLSDEIDNYVHGLQRYMKLEGLDVQSLSPNITSPKEHFEVQIDLISAATGIPKRILLGSERGELASTQDDEAWTSRVESYRVETSEKRILRPFINRLIEVGILPTPTGDKYNVEWPELTAPTAKDNADVGKTTASAMREFYSAPGSEAIGLDIFFKEVMNWPEEKIIRLQQEIEDYIAGLKEEDEEGMTFEEEEEQQVDEDEQESVE